MVATGVLTEELTSQRARPRRDHLRWPGSRRTRLRPTRPGMSLAPGPHRTALAAWQHSKAVAARRCQCWMRTRSARGAALPGPLLQLVRRTCLGYRKEPQRLIERPRIQI